MLKTYRKELTVFVFVVIFLVIVTVGTYYYVYNTPLTTTQPSATAQSTVTPSPVPTHVPMLIHKPYKLTHVWVFHDTFLGLYQVPYNATETYTIKERTYEVAWSCIFDNGDGIITVTNNDEALTNLGANIILAATCEQDTTSGYVIVNTAPGTISVTITCWQPCTIEIGEK